MIKNYIIVIIFILIIDLIWLLLNSNNYKLLVLNVQKSDLIINPIGALLSYLTVILALFCFSIPIIKEKIKNNNNLLYLSFIYGGGLGFLMYGIFNSTNLGIFKNYSPKIAIIDTLWGTILFTISVYLYFILEKQK